MPNLDADAVVLSALDAIPHATPDVVAEFLLAQLPFLDELQGLALAARMFARLKPAAWVLQIGGTVLDRLPDAVVALTLARLRELPPGPLRIEALCGIPSRLTRAEQREVLDGILDATLR